MSTLANSIRLHFRSTVFVKVKKIFRQRNTIYFLYYNPTPLDMYIGLCPMFIVSNQKEESISIQRVKD